MVRRGGQKGRKKTPGYKTTYLFCSIYNSSFCSAHFPLLETRSDNCFLPTICPPIVPPIFHPFSRSCKGLQVNRATCSSATHSQRMISSLVIQLINNTNTIVCIHITLRLYINNKAREKKRALQTRFLFPSKRLCYLGRTTYCLLSSPHPRLS